MSLTLLHAKRCLRDTYQALIIHLVLVDFIIYIYLKLITTYFKNTENVEK